MFRIDTPDLASIVVPGSLLPHVLPHMHVDRQRAHTIVNLTTGQTVFAHSEGKHFRDPAFDAAMSSAGLLFCGKWTR